MDQENSDRETLAGKYFRNLVVEEGGKEVVDGDVGQGELGANSETASAYDGCLELPKPLTKHNKMS